MSSQVTRKHTDSGGARKLTYLRTYVSLTYLPTHLLTHSPIYLLTDSGGACKLAGLGELRTPRDPDADGAAVIIRDERGIAS